RGRAVRRAQGHCNPAGGDAQGRRLAARLAAASLIFDHGWGKPARGLSSQALEEKRLFEEAERGAREILARREGRSAYPKTRSGASDAARVFQVQSVKRWGHAAGGASCQCLPHFGAL